MPKKTKSSPQPTLFHHDIPQMPDGYYSSGPNPNLQRFVEEHATPYDLAADDYNITPFDQPITTTKSTAIYNMYAYWSKKPHDAIQQYILHYTQPGDLVLDSFCGSGGTALAALMEGRSAIAIDLSPAATFITKNYCTAVDMDELQHAFEELKTKVKSEMDWLYETRCDRCDGHARTEFTVYSLIVECPRCLEKVHLYDAIEKKGITHDGRIKNIKICPFCLSRGHNEELGKPGSKRFGIAPVSVNYSCLDGCKPTRAERSYNDKNPKKREYFKTFDLEKISQINQLDLPYWYPEADLATSIPYRMFVKKDFRAEDASKLSDFFTKRNLWALSLVLDACNNNDELRGILNSSIMASSRRAQHLEEGGGYIPGTYHLPPLAKERNVLGVVERIENKTNIARYEIIKKLKSNSLLISTQNATRLETIPSNSIDYIFTDPPYSGNIQYGELNFLWEAWMGFDTSWRDQEIIVSEVTGKTEADWESRMSEAFSECYRVLKPGRWLSLCYHDSSEGTWQIIQDLMSEIGFISEWIESALFIDTGGKTYNQYNADKVTKRDLVINFRKPREGEIAAKVLLTGEEDPSSFSEKAQLILREALDRHPGTSADHLYDELVSRMVSKGQFQRHNFDELLRSVAEEIGGRWYLLETADQLDETETKKENAAASRLEALMQKFIKENPGEIGVHYSNLFEEYLPIVDKPRRLLLDWLSEYFFKTEDGTWRPSINDDESEQKLSLRLSGELRHIKRFANALSAGVPPAERDRPSNAATLAEWIYQCRRSGLYDLGSILYERGGLRFDSLKEERQLQVEEDYQICIKRGSPAKGKSKKTKKKSKPAMFDEADQ